VELSEATIVLSLNRSHLFSLPEGKYYAFQINIKSPEFWNMSQHDGWRLWLQSPDGYMVDGSKQLNCERWLEIFDRREK
jgi:hypothetical protein